MRSRPCLRFKRFVRSHSESCREVRCPFLSAYQREPFVAIDSLILWPIARFCGRCCEDSPGGRRPSTPPLARHGPILFQGEVHHDE